MRVLAIGSNGFIGAHVVRSLSARGHEVAVLHRSDRDAALPPEVRHIRGDRDALPALRSKLERFAPEVVVDMIPYTGRHARAFVEVFRGHAERVVVVSSADVYRNYDGFRGHPTAAPDPVPLSEDAPLRETRYPYRGQGLPFAWADDYDKIPVERAVLGDPDLPGTVLRLPAVYGPGDPQHRLRPYIRRMDDGRPAILLSQAHARWRWTRGYVENVAAAIALAAMDGRAASRVYNVGEISAPTERTWVDEIGDTAGWSGAVVVVPSEHLVGSLGQPFDFRYDLATDTHRIRDELGYTEPVGRQTALERTLEWERSGVDELDPLDYGAEDAALAAWTDGP